MNWRLRYADCPDGVEMRLVRIDGLERCSARDEADATAELWQFFRGHSLPALR